MKLQNAIICDLDGTIANSEARTTKHLKGKFNNNWDAWEADTMLDEPIEEIIEILNRFKEDHAILLLTSRNESGRVLTEKWLKKYDVPYDELFMRGEQDYRSDDLVKEEMYYSAVEPLYRVKFVLDDRQNVVDMWRNKLGLKCLQVDYGDF